MYGQWFLLALHRPVEAERFLSYVVSRQPNHVNAHRGLATIYYDQGAWVPAVLHLIKWAELDPTEGRPHRFMGLIYKDMDQPTPAITCYREALRRRLTATVVQEVKEELAECLVAKSDFAEALAILEDCGPRQAKVVLLLALRAECLWGLRRESEAQALLDRALQDHPDFPALLRLRAKVHAAAEQPREAAALLERAIKLDPNDHASRYQLAQAYEALERPKEADEQRRQADQTKAALVEMTDLIKVAAENPWDVGVRQRLADACQKLNKPDLAAIWQRATATCPPAPPETRKE
jgi:tetratricopeptide (TPR) repeat protein